MVFVWITVGGATVGTGVLAVSVEPLLLYMPEVSVTTTSLFVSSSDLGLLQAAKTRAAALIIAIFLILVLFIYYYML
jgi:hypothetical protein